MRKLLAASVFFFITGTANWCQVKPWGDYDCSYTSYEFCVNFCTFNCTGCVANPNNIFK